MLLAVEGGGFFSSSASGYSKGLTLLLLGQKTEDKPMRVSPWNQYELVDENSDSSIQLATMKSRLYRGCTSFVCFGRNSSGLDSPSPLKVGPLQHQGVLPECTVSDNGKDHTTDIQNDGDTVKISLKSSLKKPSNNVPALVEGSNECEALDYEGSNITRYTERRKVQWTDTTGSELVEIREFEPSEADGSDDEFENGSVRSCACAIM